MEIMYTESNILFLRGCFPNNCDNIEDLFDERIIRESNPDSYDSIIYDKIPSVFESLTEWPMKNNLKCWNCDSDFNNIPIFIPSYLGRYTPHNNLKKVIKTLGNFCKWGCASRYIDDNFRRDDKWEKHALLKQLYNTFTGRNINDIIMAPKRVRLHIYGGDLTYADYSEMVPL
jgi:hypothetical protein